MKLVLTAYQVRILLSQLCALTDAGAETLEQKEIDALDAIISKLNKAAGGIVKDGE